MTDFLSGDDDAVVGDAYAFVLSVVMLIPSHIDLDDRFIFIVDDNHIL